MLQLDERLKNGAPSLNGTPIVVQVQELRKELKMGEVTVQALRGVSFRVAQGEFLGIVGPSGSGKSTLLGLMGGLDAPTGGSIVIDGADITSLSERALTRLRNEKIGFIFQFFNLIPTLTALENVALPAQFSKGRKVNPTKRAKELLDMFGLGERMNHRPTQLSGGQQQRVAIARALVNHPPLLLCDEPTGSLDSESSEVVMKALREAQSALKATVVIVTHSADVASQVDRLITLADGQLVDDTDPRATAQWAAVNLLKQKRATGQLPPLDSVRN